MLKLARSSIFGAFRGRPSLCLCCFCVFKRSSVVACFGPLLQRKGYGLNAKEGAILVYGGLRGCIAAQNPTNT
eukprot:3909101-Amphidinium_carterae.1